MAVAWLLTILGLCGAMAGVLIGEVRGLSAQLGAAGGGLLTGVAVFFVIPEIAELCGWAGALLLAFLAALAMLLLDRFLAHSGHGVRQGVAGPLLAAAAVHSFLDGWSVRVFSASTLAGAAVPVGLGLHKVPEGAALGWVARKALGSAPKALVVSAAVELITLVGAIVEPHANRSGQSQFGMWWTASVLAIIAGSFLFLGVHALWPEWKRPRVLLVFLGTLAVVAFFRR